MSYLELKGLKNLGNLEKTSETLHQKEVLENESFTYLSVEKIYPGKYQPRKDFNQEALSELASSVQVNGVVQPIIIRNLEINRYEIVAGERRFRAAKMAGLTEVPVIIRELDDRSVLAFGLIENLQREDLSPVEQAEGLNKLLEEFSLKHEEIAELVGKSRSTVTNILRLLTLESSVKDMLDSGLIEVGHAKVLLGLSGKSQIEAAEVIAEKKLNVRESEKLVRLMLNPVKKEKFVLESQLESKVRNWEQELSNHLSSKVNFHFGREGQGRLVIHFDSVDGAEWVMKMLSVNKLKET